MRAEILAFHSFSRLFLHLTYRHSTPVGFADTPSSGGGIGCDAYLKQSDKSEFERKKGAVSCILRQHLNYLCIVKQQRIPGNDIAGTVLEFQTVFFQRGDQVDTVAFYAGVHPSGHTAGLSIQESAALTNRACLRG